MASSGKNSACDGLLEVGHLGCGFWGGRWRTPLKRASRPRRDVPLFFAVRPHTNVTSSTACGNGLGSELVLQAHPCLSRTGQSVTKSSAALPRVAGLGVLRILELDFLSFAAAAASLRCYHI